MQLNLVTKIQFIWIVPCSFSIDVILLLLLEAEKVLLLLVISLTVKRVSFVTQRRHTRAVVSALRWYHGVLRLPLTHWGRVMYICVSKLAIIDSDNGLSPGRRQAIILTNVGILLIGPLGTNFSEILIETDTISFKKIHLKMSSRNRRPFCLGLNVLSSYSAIWDEVVTPFIGHRAIWAVLPVCRNFYVFL